MASSCSSGDCTFMYDASISERCYLKVVSCHFNHTSELVLRAQKDHAEPI